ncbi:M23 family metallopeptidase [Dysgonomonas macrotermitis]|uniref:Murein DD-endopeptidase MepM and murein hydrolase activator NlpD, contain LysM domain n=1 Tax=Dysgonomonas macrotermitis TaxID=1346286 RepID=A0A1M5BT62_9BACT|nr:M23 family metallopeptidase [Dysgonomonas macrotermitis]SHF45764.1 Murein DD-endopeptidase MepM and murein hydrolase activator NlpD, contain LysM domain [Dysgonomonas macrotermitis]
MAKKVYYIYNPQSLTYERVYPSIGKKVFIIIRNLLGGIILGAVGFWALMYYVLDSPKEMELKKENKLIRAQYNILSKRLENVSEVLKDIQQRDDNMYRAIFHADPIASAIRNSTGGGVGKYDYLMELSNPDLIMQTSKKMDLISRQLYVQSKSFDEILNFSKQQKDRLQHIPSIQPVANKDLSRVASGYGTRIDPIYGTLRFHAGMDFTAKEGTDIYATGDGVVVWAEWRQGYGNCIIIDHGYGFETLYGHMSAYVAKAGQNVKRGELIGKIGSTGKSTGPHLHYEVHVKGKPDNPAKYYFMDLTPEEYDQMLRIADNHGQVMD